MTYHKFMSHARTRFFRSLISDKCASRLTYGRFIACAMSFTSQIGLFLLRFIQIVAAISCNQSIGIYHIVSRSLIQPIYHNIFWKSCYLYCQFTLWFLFSTTTAHRSIFSPWFFNFLTLLVMSIFYSTVFYFGYSNWNSTRSSNLF